MNPPNASFDPSHSQCAESPGYNEPLPGLQAPPMPAAAPPVVMWYRVYCVVLLLLYFACACGGVALIALRGQMADAKTPEVEWLINGIVLLGTGVVMFALFLAALVLPVRPWTWVYHLVMIALGLTSCCTWSATIPLLIQWLKPATQHYFGRDTTSTPPAPNYPPPPIPRV
jgi:hypothetical protein